MPALSKPALIDHLKTKFAEEIEDFGVEEQFRMHRITVTGLLKPGVTETEALRDLVCAELDANTLPQIQVELKLVAAR